MFNLLCRVNAALEFLSPKTGDRGILPYIILVILFAGAAAFLIIKGRKPKQ